jgi:molybdopterin/thiamine biosynthesis adenylyltransferase/rhodanese-related sulfurtransferase
MLGSRYESDSYRGLCSRGVIKLTQTDLESAYYARHFKLPGFTERTQQRLRDARVLIVGLGGLGCPAALYLAGAGVGTIALCDGDSVSTSNLHRQVLFDVEAVGQSKVDVAAKRLRAVNPHIKIETIPKFADPRLLSELLPRFDLVLDGTDNFSAKYALNDACEVNEVPLVYGSIFQFEGQMSVFHLKTAQRTKGFSYRDLYPDAPPMGLTQNCGEAGVIGVLPGIIGTMQANEAIKIITGIGEPLSGQLLTYDALTGSSHRLLLSMRDRRPCDATALHDIGDIELLELLASPTPPALIDIRDPDERQTPSLGGLHIPLISLPQHLHSIAASGIVVVYCKSGVRSAKAVLYLRSVLPHTNVFSLRGGLDACSNNLFVRIA